MSSSKKPSNADTIASLPAVEKVNLLAQALLREYMHRRGFRQTLSAFDVENPRDNSTISSRQLMSDLMRLGKIQERNLRNGAGGKGAFSTFMEMLCSYRIRKRAIRRNRAGVVTVPAATESDSSDDEARAVASATEHQAALRSAEAAVASEVQDVSLRIEALRKTLEGLRAREAKLLKKQRRTQHGAGGDDDRPSAAKASTKKKKNASSDPLRMAMDVLEHLPPAGSGGHGHASGGGAVGRNWTPCGASSSAQVPEIGLNSSTGATLGTAPSFVAGEGFRLMGDRGGATTHKEMPEWEAPTNSSNTTSRRSSAASSNGGDDMSSSSLQLGDDGDDGSPVPSPYRIGKTPYDPSATRPGILRAGADGGGGANRSAAAIGGSTSASPPGGPSARKKMAPQSNSPTGSGGGGISPVHEAMSTDGSSGSSPTGVLRHGFHQANGSPPSTEKQLGASRTRRKVTILAD